MMSIRFVFVIIFISLQVKAAECVDTSLEVVDGHVPFANYHYKAFKKQGIFGELRKLETDQVDYDWGDRPEIADLLGQIDKLNANHQYIVDLEYMCIYRIISKSICENFKHRQDSNVYLKGYDKRDEYQFYTNLGQQEKDSIYAYGRSDVYSSLDGLLRTGQLPDEGTYLYRLLQGLDSTMKKMKSIDQLRIPYLFRGSNLLRENQAGRVKVGANWKVSEFVSSTYRTVVATQFALASSAKNRIGNLLIDIIETSESNIKGVDINSVGNATFPYEEEVILDRTGNFTVTKIEVSRTFWGGKAYFRYLKVKVD